MKQAVKAMKAKKAMKAMMKKEMKVMKAVRAKKTTAAPKKAVKAMKVAAYQSRHIDSQPHWLLMKDFVQRQLKCHVLPERKKWKHDILTDFMFDLMLHRRFIIAHQRGRRDCTQFERHQGRGDHLGGTVLRRDTYLLWTHRCVNRIWLTSSFAALGSVPDPSPSRHDAAYRAHEQTTR